MRKRILTVLLVTAFALTGVMAQAALSAYMTVRGQKQGDIKGGVMDRGREGTIRVVGSSHDIISPRDPQSGLPTGKRMHKPFLVQIPLDQAVPLLYNSLTTNENLTQVAINYWSPNVQGIDVNNYRVELVNANIAEMSFHESTEKTTSGDVRVPYVEIAFTYQKITWTWLDGKTSSASDDWEARA